jgi:4-hydroxyacetophenone monooxygenase
MSQHHSPAGIPFDDGDAVIAAALEEASIPALMLAMVHMTGDSSLLEGDIRPAGVYINEYQGFMAPEQQAQVRGQALEVIKVFRDGGCQLPPSPDRQTIHSMMNFLVAEEVSADYIPMILEELELDGCDSRDVSFAGLDERDKQNFPVVIIGGGMSGVLAAIKLKEAGIPFTVIEKNPGPGGTWFENRYPGARVDVGNHFYCYSFEPNHNWSEFFSQQPELQAYFEHCVSKYGVGEYFRYDTEVVTARFDETSQQWAVTVRDSDGKEEVLPARSVISAVGQLNRPNIPAIKGSDTFTGPAFHSAQWRAEVDLKGKRVAVIGAGASAFQLVPEIAKEAAELKVYQRSAPWMFENPSYHEQVGEGTKWLLKHLPFYARWLRFLMFWPACDGAWPFVTVDPEWPHQDRSINEVNEMIRETFTEYITNQVGDDKDLLAKVIPDYAPMAKRTLQDNGSWLAALKRDNVELIAEPASEITERGVVSSGGEFEADVIIFATGFKANKFLWPMEIIGRNGAVLSEQWGDEPEAYLGLTVPNFPNLFCMFGPATNLAFGGSLILNGECQMRYIMESFKLMLEQGLGSMDCKQAVHDDYNQRLRETHAGMIWEHASIKSSFYQNSKGHATLLWPWKILDYWSWTKSPKPDDYDLS